MDKDSRNPQLLEHSFICSLQEYNTIAPMVDSSQNKTFILLEYKVSLYVMLTEKHRQYKRGSTNI